MSYKFYDLDIWKSGHDLLMKVYDVCMRFPEEEKYCLRRDIIRSANSVIANIAEGHGRYYFKDKIRVLYIARGEIEETQSHLRVAFSRNYISEESFKELDSGYEGLNIGINLYIKSISDKIT